MAYPSADIQVLTVGEAEHFYNLGFTTGYTNGYNARRSANNGNIFDDYIDAIDHSQYSIHGNGFAHGYWWGYTDANNLLNPENFDDEVDDNISCPA